MSRLLAAAALGLVLVAGCGGGDESSFTFTADSAVADGEPVGVFFTCDGEEVSPTLVWRDVPSGAQELALVVEDPDAPEGTFTHWLVYGLDPGVDSLPNAIGPWPRMSSPRALRQGQNDFGRVGYAGPCPPPSEEHEYVFRLLALDQRIELPPGATRPQFDAAVEPHVIEETSVTTSYGRD